MANTKLILEIDRREKYFYEPLTFFETCFYHRISRKQSNLLQAIETQLKFVFGYISTLETELAR